jgi:hypothetical protein
MMDMGDVESRAATYPLARFRNSNRAACLPVPHTHENCPKLPRVRQPISGTLLFAMNSPRHVR